MAKPKRAKTPEEILQDIKTRPSADMAPLRLGIRL
jgi:hypothetical protein